MLKTSGWAILLVPITVAQTVEDPGVTDPKDRLRLFGQDDHVHRYGPDYMDRLSAAGFRVKRIRPADFLSASNISQMAITAAAGEVYFCEKQQGNH